MLRTTLIDNGNTCELFDETITMGKEELLLHVQAFFGSYKLKDSTLKIQHVTITHIDYFIKYVNELGSDLSNHVVSLDYFPPEYINEYPSLRKKESRVDLLKLRKLKAHHPCPEIASIMLEVREATKLTIITTDGLRETLHIYGSIVLDFDLLCGFLQQHIVEILIDKVLLKGYCDEIFEELLTKYEEKCARNNRVKSARKV